MNILLVKDKITEENITLTNPNGIQGGSYLTKIKHNNENSIYLQTPKLKTKQGIIKTDKRSYFDILIDRDNSELVEWIENLEEILQDKIYEKRNSWFETKIDKEDIQNSMTPMLRPFRGGKFNLLRVSIPAIKGLIGHNKCVIYDENEEAVNMDAVSQDKTIICILEITGVKFSSKYFQIDINARQIMVCKDYENFNNCLIKQDDTTTVLKQKEPVIVSKEEPDIVAPEEPINVVEEEQSTIVQKNEDVLEQRQDPEDNLTIDTNIETDSMVRIKAPKSKQQKFTYLDESSEQASNTLEEIDIDINPEVKDDDVLELKSKEFYYDIYRNAMEKAKRAKKEALESFLEAKKIKDTYMLDDLEDDSLTIDDLEDSESNIGSDLEEEYEVLS
jgi:hypothetical protein